MSTKKTMAHAYFEVSSESGETLMFTELISLPRAVDEQIKNHHERLSLETGNSDVKLIKISEL